MTDYFKYLYTHYMAGSCNLGYEVDDARDYLNPKPFPLF